MSGFEERLLGTTSFFTPGLGQSNLLLTCFGPGWQSGPPGMGFPGRSKEWGTPRSCRRVLTPSISVSVSSS